MKSDILLAIVAIAMLVVFVDTGIVEHMMQAEAIAEDLAPQIGVDEDIVRSHLESILRSGSARRAARLRYLSLLVPVRRHQSRNKTIWRILSYCSN